MRLLTYLRTEAACLEQAKGRGFVRRDTLDVQASGGAVFVTGHVACYGALVIGVREALWLDRRDVANPTIEDRDYAYNASVQGSWNVLRYDNAAHHLHRPGHEDEHHRHVFDWRTGAEDADSPAWVGEARSPSLGDFLLELERWWQDHFEELRQVLGDPYREPDLSRTPKA